ncbi:MAG: hypothetical protein K6C40_08575, partial [Thermoguttaceae bacterium]|nr:hypothetical protein [Thermoguttaceae bacterium]
MLKFVHITDRVRKQKRTVMVLRALSFVSFTNRLVVLFGLFVTVEQFGTLQIFRQRVRELAR